MEAKPPKIQGLAVTLSGEGRGNGKKPIWVWGALLGKGAKGMRDGMKFLREGEYVS
jgi:hypothetical protein